MYCTAQGMNATVCIPQQHKLSPSLSPTTVLWSLDTIALCPSTHPTPRSWLGTEMAWLGASDLKCCIEATLSVALKAQKALGRIQRVRVVFARVIFSNG